MDGLLDALDRKILQELETDARQSNARIARKLKINKTLIAYRIARLHQKSIVTGYKYLSNQAILGKLSFGLLIKFRDLLLPQQIVALKKISTLKSVSWTASTEGAWDAFIVVIEKDISAFNEVFTKICVLCNGHIKEYAFYVDYAGAICGHDYLYALPRDISISYATEKTVALKDIELNVYVALKKDPRLSLLSLATMLHKTYDTVKTKFEYLKSRKILLRPTPIINFKLLGYQETLCVFNVAPVQGRVAQLLHRCILHPSIVRQSQCFGHFNLILTIHTKDNYELKGILASLKKEFSDIINTFEIIPLAE